MTRREASFLHNLHLWRWFYGALVLAAWPLLSPRDLAGCVMAGLMVDAALRVRPVQGEAEDSPTLKEAREESA